MKWITLNGGSLINLENLVYICVAGPTVKYYDNSDAPVKEEFSSPTEAVRRMEELRKMLTEEEP